MIQNSKGKGRKTANMKGRQKIKLYIWKLNRAGSPVQNLITMGVQKTAKNIITIKQKGLNQRAVCKHKTNIRI